MSSQPSTYATASPLSFTDGHSADGERFLADASARLAESLDVMATIRTLTQLAVESFADGCRVTLLDEAAQARGDYPFVHVAIHGRSPKHEAIVREIHDRYPFPADAPVGFPAVIRTGKSELSHADAWTPAVLAGRAVNAEHLDLLERLEVRSLLFAPLVARGRTLGAITLVRHGPEERPRFTEHDVRIAEELGRRAGVAIDNARLFSAEQAARAAAEQSEARLADVLDSMVGAVYGYDHDWRIVRLNHDARRRFRDANVDPDAVMGHSLWEVFPGLVGTQMELFLRRVMEQRRPTQFIDRHLFRDEWLEVRIIPTAEGVSAYVNDITARVVADQQRDLLLRIGELVRQSLDPARTLDAIARAPLPEFADYTMIDLFDGDGTIRRVTGAHADSAQMATLMRLLAAPATLDGKNFLSQVLRTGHPVLAETIDDATIDSLTDDAEVRDIVHALAPRSCIVVPLAADGPTLGALLLGRSRAIVRPFTDGDLSVAMEIGRRAAAALEHARLFDGQRSARERAERLQNLSAALTRAATTEEVADVALRESARVLGSNTVTLCLLDDDGKTYTALAGSGIPDDLAAAWRRFPAGYDCRVSDAVRTRQPCYSLSRAEFVGGQQALIETSARLGVESSAAIPLVVGERVLGAMMYTFGTPRRFSAEDDAFLRAEAGQIAQSLERARLFEAERRARELAESANRAKGEFLALMSHELRNPLNSISGYVELLQMGIRGPVTPGQREDLHRIQEGQQQMLLLLNEVLNYARLESGAVTYDLQPTIVADVVTAAVQQFEPQRAAKMLEVVLQLSLPTSEPCVVIADAEKLQQIALNLLINAARFTAVGGRVRVRCAPLAGDATRLAIRIGDSGFDIPDDQHDTIFEPFVQVGRPSGAPGEGTGLGLAISRDLARGMGGTLKVESVTGGGSVFTLVLPRE